MTFSEYQDAAIGTAVYLRKHAVIYPALKLAGEAGEVAQKIGKVLRDKNGDFLSERTELASEIGDVLWYCAALAQDLGLTLESIAAGNIEKLRSRQERGVLSGSGDNR